MTKEETIHEIQVAFDKNVISDEASLMAIKSLEAWDTLHHIVVDVYNSSKSLEQKQTLEWVLNKMSEVEV